jgi:hypothetical protein
LPHAGKSHQMRLAAAQIPIEELSGVGDGPTGLPKMASPARLSVSGRLGFGLRDH